MRLTDSQVDQYEREGYVLVERVLSPQEVAVLAAEIPELLAAKDFPGVHRDESTHPVKLIHGPHLFSEQLRRLARHPRLLGPAEQLLRGKVYLHQSRFIPKVGISEPVQSFPWHRDYPTWHVRDGMPGPRAVVVAVFVDEVTACNGPFILIPRSHRVRQNAPEQGPAADEDMELALSPQRVKELVEEGGLVAQVGPPGSVLFMHCNLAHASTQNISPLRRAMHQLSYNSVENACVNPQRPVYQAARDFTPLEPLPEDCLLRGEAAGT